MNSPHVLHWREKGIIIRTPICFSRSRFIRGTFFGSKSGGKYLFSTLRSPMLEDQLPRPWRDGYGLLEVLEVLLEEEFAERVSTALPLKKV